jgi:hypothetical protein
LIYISAIARKLFPPHGKSDNQARTRQSGCCPPRAVRKLWTLTKAEFIKFHVNGEMIPYVQDGLRAEFFAKVLHGAIQLAKGFTPSREALRLSLPW